MPDGALTPVHGRIWRLAFLLTGPATNATTYGLLRGPHGRRVALAFTGLMIALAILLGVALDLLAPGLATSVGLAHAHAEPGLFADLHLESTIWNDFKFRDDDFIVATYAKSGTTWMQQMLAQMMFGPDPELAVADMSQWLDLRVPPKEVKLPAVEAQTHRRFLKTHLPVDALVYSPRAKYIYIGRDGRDVVWSMYNHHVNANALWYQALNDTPGRAGPPIEPPPADIRRYFVDWLMRDGHPFWPFWKNVRSWWAIRGLPNLMFVHYEDLKRDMAGEMRAMAKFLDITVDEAKWPKILEYCSFDWMKANATKSVPLGGAFWDAGAQVFINKGENGRWRDTLTQADISAYDTRAMKELVEECARWLATGAARR